MIKRAFDERAQDLWDRLQPDDKLPVICGHPLLCRMNSHCSKQCMLLALKPDPELPKPPVDMHAR